MIFNLIYRLVKYLAPHFGRDLLNQVRKFGFWLSVLETEQQVEDLHQAILDRDVEAVEDLLIEIGVKVGMDDATLIHLNNIWDTIQEQVIELDPDMEETEIIY